MQKGRGADCLGFAGSAAGNRLFFQRNTPRGSYDSTNDLKSAKSGTVASNKRFTLLWDEQTKSVFFQDKQTSKIWGTVPYEYYFSGASMRICSCIPHYHRVYRAGQRPGQDPLKATPG